MLSEASITGFSWQTTSQPPDISTRCLERTRHTECTGLGLWAILSLLPYVRGANAL